MQPDPSSFVTKNFHVVTEKLKLVRFVCRIPVGNTEFTSSLTPVQVDYYSGALCRRDSATDVREEGLLPNDNREAAQPPISRGPNLVAANQSARHIFAKFGRKPKLCFASNVYLINALYVFDLHMAVFTNIHIFIHSNSVLLIQQFKRNIYDSYYFTIK